MVKKLPQKPVTVKAASVTTPIEQSGLTPLWQENFTDGKMDRFQYSFATGNNSALDTKLMPGMIYLGKNGGNGTDQVEQEIFNFKGVTSPWPHTIEFDVFSPQTGNGRVSIRPRVGGDFVHMNFGLPGDATKINFRFGVQPSYTYTTLTGPTRGWAHIVASYEQVVVGGVLQGHYVIAVNGEVREYQGDSKITDYSAYWTITPNAYEWDIETKSNDIVYGRYVTNIRAYSQFLPLSEMQGRLTGVDTYRSTLTDPRNYSGPSKLFQTWKTLIQAGPNALMYTSEIGPLTVEFDGSLSSAWQKITSYNWNFGDGAIGQGRVLTHTYAAPGTYQVTLSVTSPDGTDSYSTAVTVSASTTVSPTIVLTPTDTPTPTTVQSPTPTPQVVVVNPVADTYVNSNNATKNYGLTNPVVVDGSPVKIIYLKFSIPSGPPIISAKLRLNVAEGSTAVESIKDVVDTTWGETTMNYNSRPALGSQVGAVPTSVTGQWVESDLSSYMAGKSGQTIAIGIDSTSGNGMSVSSRESVNKPVLELNY